MSTLIWDRVGEKAYESGVDHGVLYVQGHSGVPWNGLTGLSEKPSGASANAIYADDKKYLNLISPENFGASLQAYTYPKLFEECDGSANIGRGLLVAQQPRKTFGFSYRTLMGNDIEGLSLGYKIHLVYGCLASPSEKARSTINDTPSAMVLNWELTTTPVPVPGKGTTSHLTIVSTEANVFALKFIEEILYGTPTTDPRLPTPAELMAIVSLPWPEPEPEFPEEPEVPEEPEEPEEPEIPVGDIFVTDDGDDLYTIEGTSTSVKMITEDVYEISSQTVTKIDEDTYEITSGGLSSDYVEITQTGTHEYLLSGTDESLQDLGNNLYRINSTYLALKSPGVYTLSDTPTEIELRVSDNGSGEFTIFGTDDRVIDLGDGEYRIVSDGVVMNEPGSYTINDNS